MGDGVGELVCVEVEDVVVDGVERPDNPRDEVANGVAPAPAPMLLVGRIKRPFA